MIYYLNVLIILSYHFFQRGKVDLLRIYNSINYKLYNIISYDLHEQTPTTIRKILPVKILLMA